MTATRVVGAAVVVGWLAFGGWLVWSRMGVSGVAAGPGLWVSAPIRPSAVEVVREWDTRRAAAYARGDLGALRDLYVPGSVVGRRDVAILRAYVRRGLRVAGLRTQLFEVRVLARGGGRLRLRVTDRVAGARAVGRDGAVALPLGQPRTRDVVLVRGAGRWRVAAVH